MLAKECIFLHSWRCENYCQDIVQRMNWKSLSTFNTHLEAGEGFSITFNSTAAWKFVWAPKLCHSKDKNTFPLDIAGVPTVGRQDNELNDKEMGLHWLCKGKAHVDAYAKKKKALNNKLKEIGFICRNFFVKGNTNLM